MFSCCFKSRKIRHLSQNIMTCIQTELWIPPSPAGPCLDFLHRPILKITLSWITPIALHFRPCDATSTSPSGSENGVSDAAGSISMLITAFVQRQISTMRHFSPRSVYLPCSVAMVSSLSFRYDGNWSLRSVAFVSLGEGGVI